MAKAKGKMIAVTSGMGSIADAGEGNVPYRSSKAALNMAWRSLAMSFKADGIAMAVINPGWVKTDMGGPNAAITPQRSITGVRREIDALTIERTGNFLSWDGKQWPW